MFNLCVIVAGLLMCIGLLFIHTALADKHAEEMKQVSDQLANIQWPVDQSPNRHHK